MKKILILLICYLFITGCVKENNVICAKTVNYETYKNLETIIISYKNKKITGLVNNMDYVFTDEETAKNNFEWINVTTEILKSLDYEVSIKQEENVIFVKAVANMKSSNFTEFDIDIDNYNSYVEVLENNGYICE